jgi:hypothetical protein
LLLLLLPGMVGHIAAPIGMVVAAAGYGWTPCCSYGDGPCCCCVVWLDTVLLYWDGSCCSCRLWLDILLLLLRWSLLLLPGMVGHRAALTGTVLAAAAGYGWTPCCSYWDGRCCCCRVWLDTVLLLLAWTLLLLPGMVGHRAAPTEMVLAAAARYGWTLRCSHRDGPCCCCRALLNTVLLLLGWSLLLLLPGVVGHCAARSSTKLARQIIPPIKNGQVRCKNVHGALWHASSSSYRKGT